MTRGLATVLGLLLLSANGCGAEVPATATEICPPVPIAAAAPTPKPATTAKPGSKPTAKPTAKPATGTPTPKPGASASAKPADPDPAPAADDPFELLNAVKEYSLGQPSMKATISSYEMKADKSKSNTATFNLQVQGDSYRLDCIKHTKSNNVGSKTVLVYGQDSARVKPTGLLSLVTVTLKLTDANLISQNGITLDKILSHGVLERVTSGGYTAEVAGKTKIGNDPVTLIKLRPESGDHPLTKDADYEYVGFDDNNMYRMWGLYGKAELGLPQNNLLYQITVDSAEAGAPVSPDVFKL